MSTATSRETLDVLEARLQAFLARHEHGADPGDTLAERLASLECAYEELLMRLRRYEQERAEIRTRVGKLLALMGRP